MTRQKAIFMDKDGTLIKDVPYNVDTNLISFEKGVMEGLALLRDAPFILVIVSNQSGVAKGFFKEKALQPVIKKMDDLFREIGVELKGFYYCPHDKLGTVQAYRTDCECHKPLPGMLFKAATELQIDLKKSWMIGDILNDVQAGNTAGCRTVLIDNGNETEWHTGPHRTPDYVADDFYKAIHFILSEDQQKEVAV